MNDLCGVFCLFVFLRFAAHKNKVSWRKSLMRAFLLSLYFFFSPILLSLSLLHALGCLSNPPRHLGPSHPPLAGAEINCWLKKLLATPSLWSKNKSTGFHMRYQAIYLLWIIRADSGEWYNKKGIYMADFSMLKAEKTILHNASYGHI